MEKWLTKSQEPSWPKGRELPRSFYFGNTLEIARELLGKGLWVNRGRAPVLAKIVEVEAYLGQKDPASHSFRGPTQRNQMMFEAGGVAYVYLSYGVHWCMNVVTQEKGLAEAILIRACEPLLGVEEMKRRRKINDERALMNGPGKLTQALGVSLEDNGRAYSEENFCLVDLGESIASSAICASPRIGISKAKEEPFRFTLRDNPWVSR